MNDLCEGTSTREPIDNTTHQQERCWKIVVIAAVLEGSQLDHTEHHGEARSLHVAYSMIVVR